MPANRNVTSIETYSGRYVDLLFPDPATIILEDIAVALSNIPRFAGGINRFYSVAEHAVRVSYGVPDELKLAGLHHDSHEYVLGDLTAPLKTVIRMSAPTLMSNMALRLDMAIGRALDISWIEFRDPRIKEADDEAMYVEAAALKWSHGVGEHWLNDVARTPWYGMGWDPATAERKFYERHMELTQ